MENFGTTTTVVKNFVVPSDHVRDMADNIEGVLNDYIRDNWNVRDVREVPLEVRKQLLLHIVKQMVNSNSIFENREHCPDSDFLWT